MNESLSGSESVAQVFLTQYCLRGSQVYWGKKHFLEEGSTLVLGIVLQATDTHSECVDARVRTVEVHVSVSRPASLHT